MTRFTICDKEYLRVYSYKTYYLVFSDFLQFCVHLTGKRWLYDSFTPVHSYEMECNIQNCHRTTDVSN